MDARKRIQFSVGNLMLMMVPLAVALSVAGYAMRHRGAAGMVYAAGAVVIGFGGAVGMLTGGRGRMYFGIAIGVCIWLAIVVALTCWKVI
jgi:hypothetical protein